MACFDRLKRFRRHPDLSSTWAQKAQIRQCCESLPCIQWEDSLLHVCVGWWCWCESSMWSTVWIILLLKRCWMKSLGPDRGRKSPADSHIERVQSPPASSRDITIWREAYTACLGLSERRSSFHNTLLSILSLLRWSSHYPAERSQSSSPQKPPLHGLFIHLQEGGTGWTSLIWDCTKTVNKYDG